MQQRARAVPWAWTWTWGQRRGQCPTLTQHDHEHMVEPCPMQVPPSAACALCAVKHACMQRVWAPHLERVCKDEVALRVKHEAQRPARP